jgi:hypothetical protein
MANQGFCKRWLMRLGIMLILGVMGLGISGCGGAVSKESLDLPIDMPTPFRSARFETVQAPPIVTDLAPWLETADPQVKILSPKPNEVIQDTTLAIKLRVKDLTIYKDAQWQLGPHLHLILDNQPYQPVYSVDEPFVLQDLTPGTHTLRVFAAKPWHESFKNAGAYAQVTFHVFTKTFENAIDESQPLLTYSRPTGVYGAQPVMVDFYLTNAPLHMIAQESTAFGVRDWRIRLTINGDSQVFDAWEPLYIQGLKPGQNWIQLELIDDLDQPIENPFNNTARLITYEPGGEDTLSKMVRRELTLADIRSIVDPSYVPPPSPPVVTPAVEPAPIEGAAEPVEPPPVEPSIEPVQPSVTPAIERFKRPQETRVTPPAVIQPEPTEPERPPLERPESMPDQSERPEVGTEGEPSTTRPQPSGFPAPVSTPDAVMSEESVEAASPESPTSETVELEAAPTRLKPAQPMAPEPSDTESEAGKTPTQAIQRFLKRLPWPGQKEPSSAKTTSREPSVELEPESREPGSREPELTEPEGVQAEPTEIKPTEAVQPAVEEESLNVVQPDAIAPAQASPEPDTSDALTNQPASTDLEATSNQPESVAAPLSGRDWAKRFQQYLKPSTDKQPDPKSVTPDSPPDDQPATDDQPTDESATDQPQPVDLPVR